MSECHGIRCVRQTEIGHLTEILMESHKLLSYCPDTWFFCKLLLVSSLGISSLISQARYSFACRQDVVYADSPHVENFPEVPGVRQLFFHVF